MYFHQGGETESSFAYSRSPAEVSNRLHAFRYHPHYDNLINQLKEQRRTTTLGTVILEPIESGVQPEYDDDGNRDVIKVINLKNEYIDFESTRSVSESFFQNNPTAQVKKNDLLIAAAGDGSLGKVDVYDRTEKSLITGEVLRIRPDEDLVDPNFLCYYLRSEWGSVQFERWFSGSSGQIHIYDSDLLNFVIPVPTDEGVSAEEQKHIARNVSSILNEARSLSQNGISMVSEAPETLLADLDISVSTDQSFLHEKGEADRSFTFYRMGDAVEDRLHIMFHHPKYDSTITSLRDEYETTTLESIVSSPIRRGVQPENKEDSQYYALKTANLKNGRIDFDSAETISKEFFDENEEEQLENGDVIVASTGRGSLGKVDTYGGEKPAIAGEHISIIRPSSNYNSYFLCYFLRSYLGAIQFERMFTGSSGMIELQPSDLRKFVVPAPTANGVTPIQQDQIAAGVEDQIEEGYELIDEANQRRAKASQKFEDLLLGCEYTSP